MVKNTTPDEAKAPEGDKPKRVIRSIDERIAELQAKADAKKAKEAEKATAKLETLDNAVVKAEAKLLALLAERKAARAAAGLPEDGVGDVIPADESDSTEG